MTDEVESVDNESVDSAEDVTEKVVEESAAENDTAAADKAEDGKAKKSVDEDGDKAKDDTEGDDDSGLEYSADDFELPEGVEVDESMMGEFLEVAGEAKLPKDVAQKLVGLYAKKQQEAADAQFQQWDNVRKEWQTNFKSDKEFGGKAFDESKSLALKALTEFGSKELKEFGEQYGWIDHPEVMKLLARVGKTLSEDKTAKGSGESQIPTEDRWYGSSGQ